MDFCHGAYFVWTVPSTMRVFFDVKTHSDNTWLRQYIWTTQIKKIDLPQFRKSERSWTDVAEESDKNNYTHMPISDAVMSSSFSTPDSMINDRREDYLCVFIRLKPFFLSLVSKNIRGVFGISHVGVDQG